MSSLRHWLSLAQRERRGVLIPLGLWGLITTLAALTGPFQTYEVLSPVPRFFYWAVVVALSVAGSVGMLRLMRGRGRMWRLAGWVPFAVALAAMVQGLNRMVFAGWAGWSDYLWLVGVVLAICTMIELAIALFAPPTAVTVSSSSSDPEAALMRRLSLERRGKLIRIEAQDHYLSVVTDTAATLILMRMSDAEALLRDVDGLRVHRSHWIKRDAVRGYHRRDGRDFLAMHDNSEVPVSRSSRKAAIEAGLIPISRNA